MSSSPRVGLQLYTLRELDPSLVLDRIAEQGYEGVELFRQHPREELEQLAARVASLGLVTCGRHVALDRLEGELDAIVEEAALLGCPRVVVPWVDPPSDRAGAEALAGRILRAAEHVAEAGLQLGYHNHWWELEPLADGTRVLDVLAGLDSDLVELELDLGWAWYAFADPAELVRRHAGRIPLVHVKDFRRRERDASCPVGEGQVGYQAIVAAAHDAGIEWLIVEQEGFEEDPFAETARSAAALRSLLKG